MQYFQIKKSMKKILVIDDDPDILDALEKDVKSFGYDVEKSVDGISGLRKIENHPSDFGLVILDYMLPKMDGAKFARLVKFNKTTKDIPIIMLTGRVQKDTIDKAKITNIELLVFKPYCLEEMKKEIKRLFKND